VLVTVVRVKQSRASVQSLAIHKQQCTPPDDDDDDELLSITLESGLAIALPIQLGRLLLCMQCGGGGGGADGGV
jgi:hypothetical protein